MDDKLVKRQLSNFLIKPLVQTKLGLYCIGLTLAFTMVLSGIFYVNMSKFVSYTIRITQAEGSIEGLLINYLGDIQIWLYLSFIAYVSSVVALSVWYTHRMVGPMVAFEKHFEALQSGDFSYRTYLRKSDSFHEAANSLNVATESLQDRFNASTAKASLDPVFIRADLPR